MTEHDEKLFDEMRRLAEAGDVAGFLIYAKTVHASDLSDVLAQLDEEVQLRLVQALPPAVVSQALAEMEEEEHPEELLAALKPEQAAGIVDHLEDDDAVDLIADLPTESAKRVLSRLADRADIEKLLLYGEETAGGLMTTSVVAVTESATIESALESIRTQAEEVEDFYQVYCIDDQRTLVGILSMQKLVVSRPERLVRDVMDPSPATVQPGVDQEEVARLIARYNVASIPVIDALGRLLGRVTFDDVIDVVEAETTEDLLKFGGVSSDEHLAGGWAETVRSRLPWLFLNLLTASAAGAVVYFFQDTVSRVVALAVWMPIIAGMGGNAGTQALAVTVRRISLGLMPRDNAFRVVAKEFVVGMINGLAVGLAVCLVAAGIGQGWQIGIVVMFAMWGNLVVAAVAGSFVPLVLEKLDIDPAVASSVFVTALTDFCGFALLLGLGTWILLGFG
jgi:magnesium transporter